MLNFHGIEIVNKMLMLSKGDFVGGSMIKAAIIPLTANGKRIDMLVQNIRTGLVMRLTRAKFAFSSELKMPGK
jgi:hypothetical protein